MIAFGNYTIWQVIWFSVIASTVVYALTYLTIGDRAERYPGAAVGAAIVLSPWWAGFSAGLIAHLCCVMLVRAIKKQPVSKSAKTGLVLAMAVLSGGIEVSLYQDTNAVVETAKASSDQAWAKIAQLDEAGRFVSENYRPCIDAVDTPVLRPHGVSALSHRRTDPLVCKAAAVTLAKQKSPEFGEAVAQTIDQVPNMMDLSPAAMAAVDRVVQRWGI